MGDSREGTQIKIDILNAVPVIQDSDDFYYFLSHGQVSKPSPRPDRDKTLSEGLFYKTEQRGKFLSIHSFLQQMFSKDIPWARPKGRIGIRQTMPSSCKRYSAD